MENHLLKDNTLLETGYKTFEIPVPHLILLALEKRDWDLMDRTVFNLTKKEGFLFSLLQNFHSFDSIEHLINIRKGEDDEDGIWHDDGSRLMAFSLSLNENLKSLKGGDLLFRKKRSLEKPYTLGPYPLGSLTVFLTGRYGFEHKVCRVLSGERISIAGWCS